MSTEIVEKAHDAEKHETEEVNAEIEEVVEQAIENAIENVIKNQSNVSEEEKVAVENKEVTDDEVAPEEASAVNIIIEAVNHHKEHPLVKAVLEKVKSTLVEKAEKLEDEHSLFKVLKVVMESIEIEEMQELSKKELAESVLKSLVEESEMSDEKKKVCLDLIDSGTIGDTMELVVAATKGELAINKKTKRKVLACLGKCIRSVNK